MDSKVLLVDESPGRIVGLSGNPLIVDRMADSLSRLSLKDGDVLLVRMPDAKEDVKPLVAYLRKWLRNNGLERVRLLGVAGDIGLEAVSPEQMKAFGWVRA